MPAPYPLVSWGRWTAPTVSSLNTWMRLPMVKSIAQRLGRNAEPQIEAVFKGPATFVIRTERGWKTLKELPKHSWDWKDEFEFWPTPASARGNLSAAAMAGLDPLDVSPFPPAMIVVRRPRPPKNADPIATRSSRSASRCR